MRRDNIPPTSGLANDTLPRALRSASNPAAPTKGTRIVIVGGGAGGLELAVRLASSHRFRHDTASEVVLVDASPTHLWKPLLHEVAAGTLRPTDGEIDFLLLGKRHGFTFELGSMHTLDRDTRLIHLASLVDERGQTIAAAREIRYDIVVLALGSVVDDFGTPGVREHAISLDEAGDAYRLHRRLVASSAASEWGQGASTAVVVVGGGATGVELAAELAEAIRDRAHFGVRHAQCPVRLVLIDAGLRLLPALDADLAARVRDELAERGVEVRLGVPVSEVMEHHVRLGDGTLLPSQITVWAAGIRGRLPPGGVDGLLLNRRGQMVVDERLRTADPCVYGLGDFASCQPDPQLPPVPALAQAAQQQARWLAADLVDASTPHPAFLYRDRGVLISLGTRDAIGRLPAWRRLRLGVRLQGALAHWAYWLLRRRHMATLHGTFRTALMTIAGAVLNRAQPVVKLH